MTVLEKLSYLTEKSPISFGGAGISGEGGGYGFGDVSEKEAETLLKESWSRGIRLYDTAPIYGFGLSEVRLGKYLPQDAFIVSKSGVDWHASRRVNMTNDPEVTQRMLHESLKRLKRESIDCYMIHWPDSKVDIRKPLEVLIRAKEQGKIRHIGLCNTTAQDFKKAQELCEIEFLQSELNLFNQQGFLALEDLWTGKFSMSWGTFDKGILTGRVNEKRTFSKSDARSWAPWWNRKEVQLKIKRVENLKKILNDYGINLSDFCIQFNLHYFGVKTCLIGFKSVGDLVDVTSNLQARIMRERIEEVLERWKNCD